MEILNGLGLILGESWAAGFNLYLTIAGLGIADRAGLIDLPGNLDILSNPLVIGVAIILFLIEFAADKIPYVDSAWDSFHTVIRPLGGSAMAYMATSNFDPSIQYSAAMIGGMVSMESHLTKATGRAAINTSPEPVTNTIASVTEDVTVVGLLWLIVNHPVIAAIASVILIVMGVVLIKLLFRFLKSVFRFFSGKAKKDDHAQ